MVSVAAATSSGYGPFSTPVAVKTLEDRKQIVLYTPCTMHDTNLLLKK